MTDRKEMAVVIAETKAALNVFETRARRFMAALDELEDVAWPQRDDETEGFR